ncbi:MAG TPA: hypothetical protein VIP52_10705 [Candidatus Dormibacteraeota bacterium]
METARTILVKADHTLPVVVIHGVVDGARYMIGTLLHPTFTASDTGSGVASSSSTLTPPATASGAGAYTFSATATDRAGNSTTVTAHYTVDYFFAFVRPLPPGPSISTGTTLQVRIQLYDVNSNPVTNGVARLLVDGAPASPSGNFNTGNLFGYQPMSQNYLYRLSTTGLANGQHLLTVVLDDGTKREESFSIGVAAPLLLGVSPTSTLAGQVVTVSGTSYTPGSIVTIQLNGLVVAHATASGTGAFTVAVTIPPNTPLGTASLAAVGTAAGGALRLESGLIQLTG